MTKRTIRAAVAVTVAALAAGCLSVTTAHAAPGRCGSATSTVSVFGFNDFHGRILNAARLFTPVEEARATAGEGNVLLLSQGDNIGASIFESMISDDTPTLEVLDGIDLDATTVGNHEFDKGWGFLGEKAIPASGMPHLGANVYHTGTTTVAAPLKEYQVFAKGGVRIGVVGAVTADTPSMVSPDGVSALTFGDPVAAVNRVTSRLLDGDETNGEADIVLASFHEGAPDGRRSATQNAAASTAFKGIYEGVDERVTAIFNGHTHQNYIYTTASGVPVIQAGQYAEGIARLDLHVDAAGKGVCGTPTARLIKTPTTAGSSARLKIVDEIVARAKETAERKGTEVIGTATSAISTPGKGGTGTRDQESPMTNMVAQMFAETLGGGDPEFIGVQNPGGTRDSFDAGEITYREAALTLPFANSLFTTKLTGAQFVKVLEQQWQRSTDGSVPSRPFLQLGLSKNITYTYDESLPEGRRITSVSVNGTPMDPGKTYTVGSGSFLIAGGDNFREFTNGRHTTDTGRADLEAWVRWVKTKATLSPDYSKRGVPVTPSTAELTEAGPAVRFTLGRPHQGGLAPQNLDMFLKDGAKASPQRPNSTVTALIDGVKIGSGTVTGGVGTVEVRLPAGTPLTAGRHIARFEVEASGTRVYLPVTVTRGASSPGPKSPAPAPSPSPDQTPGDPQRPGLPKTGAYKVSYRPASPPGSP